MPSQIARLEARDGQPIWKIKMETPQEFESLECEINFKLFTTAYGAVLAFLLRFPDHSDSDLYYQRIYDINDPTVRNYLHKIINNSHILLVLVEERGLLEIEKDLDLDGDELKELLEKGHQYNSSCPSLDTLTGLDHFQEIFSQVADRVPAGNIWPTVEEILEGERIDSKGGDSSPEALDSDSGEGGTLPSSEEGSDISSGGSSSDSHLPGGGPIGPSGGAKGYGGKKSSALPSSRSRGSGSSVGSPLTLGKGIGSSSDKSGTGGPPSVQSKRSKLGHHQAPPLFSAPMGPTNQASPSAYDSSPPSPGSPSQSRPSPTQTGGYPSGSATLSRRSTVRYFTRMYPFHTYPLRVTISEGKIVKTTMEGVVQATGEKAFEIDSQKPWITLVPVFPGALVIPDQLEVDVTPEMVEIEFWITPQTEGNIDRARIEVHHQGKKIDSVSTPYQVTRHTLAKISLGCSVAFPILGPLLQHYELDPESQLASGFPLLQPLVETIAATPLMTGFLVFLCAAGLLYWWRKPREADPITQFLNLSTVMEKESLSSIEEAHRLQDLGIAELDRNNITAALEDFEKALEIYRDQPLSFDYGTCLCNAGLCYLKLEKFEPALNTYAEELGVWVRLGRELERGRCLSNLGVLFTTHGYLSEAIPYFEEAIRLRKKGRDEKGVLRSKSQLANCYSKLGEWQKSYQLYTEVIEETPPSEELALADAHFFRGVASNGKKEYARALADYEKALPIYEKMNDYRMLTDTYFNLGLAYFSLNEDEPARKYFQEALALSKERQSRGEMVTAKEIQEIEDYLRKV